MTHIDVSSFASKANVASLKTEVDKLDINKLTPVPNDLAKLRNVVKDDVVKKTEYKKLVKKVDDIDTTGFVLKTKYDTVKSDLEKKISDADKKIPDTSGLVKKTDCNSKVTEIEDINSLATNSALTAVEKKMSNVINLIKKNRLITTDHNHDKNITTPEFNNIAAGVFTARLARANLIKKGRF